MAPNLRPKSNQLDQPLLSDRDEPLQEASSPSEKATTADQMEFYRVLDWMRNSGVENDWKKVVDVTLLLQKPNAIRNVLDVIGSELALQVLQRWYRDGSRHAGVLYRISNALRTKDLSTLSEIRALGLNKKASHHFPGVVEQYYLLALLVARPFIGKHEDVARFETFRLWVFVRALNIADRGYRREEHLSTLCASLRLAHDGIGVWPDFFCRLLPHHRRESQLIFQLKGALEHERHIQTDSQERGLLLALERVTRLENLKSKGDIGLPTPIALDTTPQDEFDDREVDKNETSRGSDRDTEAEGNLNAIVKAKVNPDDSYAFHKIGLGRLLLQRQEDIQFLPWSLPQVLPFQKQRFWSLLEQCLAATDFRVWAVSCITWIGVAAARSINQVEQLEFGDVPGPEWMVSLTLKALIRLPSRRASGWHPKTKEEQEWIKPHSAQQTIPLIEPVVRFISLLIEKRPEGESTSTLGQVWEHAGLEPPEKVFREVFKLDSFPNITSQTIAKLLQQDVFARSGDHVLANLIGAHPRTSLPGATAYSSWPMAIVKAATEASLRIPFVAEASDQFNGLGSLLAVAEPRLIQEIDSLESRLNALSRGESIIDFHNALTLHYLLKLYAATGARVLQDPFWSPSHFDWLQSNLFLNDKISGQARNGRLIAVVDELLNELQTGYLSYLGVLANVISDVSSELSEAIKNLSKKKRTQLPFFFLLGAEGGLHWKHASQSNLYGLNLFRCPLPLNLFRHRLASGLRERRISAEIVDAFLGHAERGASTHGDMSYRTWREDMDTMRVPLAELYQSLAFSLPPHWRGEPQDLQDLPVGKSPTKFGSELRLEYQKKQRIEALRSVRRITVEFLGGRTLDELSADEIEKLCRRLLCNRKGLPHPHGLLRYSVFLRFVEMRWRKLGKRIKLKKRYGALVEEPTVVTQFAPGAVQTLSRLTSVVTELADSLQPSRTGKDDAALHAVIQLAVLSRISNTELLRDVIVGKNFRLITKGGLPFLEHAPELNEKDLTAPVQRFRIHPITAKLLDRALGRSNRKKDWVAKIAPDWVGGTKEIISAHVGHQLITTSELLNSLAEIVDQANFQQLPGVVGGYLSGRLKSYSLETQEWLRVRWRESRLIEDLNAPKEEDGELSVRRLLQAKDKNSERLQNNTRTFFSKLRGVIGDEGPSPLPTQQTKDSRREWQKKIRTIIRAYNGQVEEAALLLGDWLAWLLLRPYRGGLLAIGTVRTYFTTLSGVFERTAYDANLTMLDDEGITELYCDILEAATAQDCRTVLNRLREFHRWAKLRTEIPEPDWGELPVMSNGVSVDPGVWTDTDYGNALKLLLQLESEEGNYAAFLILCIYHFGLRRSETLGLTTTDWIETEDWIVVFVKSRPHRKLKTQAARRAVPLLNEFTDREKRLVGQIVKRAQASVAEGVSSPLFSLGSGTFLNLNAISSLALSAIKFVTGNPRQNLHRGRHGVGNRITLNLLSLDLKNWKPVSAQGGDHQKTAMVLMDRQEISRRIPWAVARYLGHAGITTQFGNYLHFLSDWTELLTYTGGRKKVAELQFGVELENYPLQHPRHNTDFRTNNTQDKKNRLADVLRAMRLLGRGLPAAEVAQYLGFAQESIFDLERAITTVGERMYWNGKAVEPEHKAPPGSNNSGQDGMNWLGKIYEESWNRLIATGNENQTDPGALPSIREGARMIGSSRQLLASNSEQFSTLQIFLQIWGIDSTRFDIAWSIEDPTLIENAREFDFSPRSCKEIGGRVRGVQVDKMLFNDEPFAPLVQSRCGLLLTESSDGVIRNRFELVVAFLATLTAANVQKIQP